MDTQIESTPLTTGKTKFIFAPQATGTESFSPRHALINEKTDANNDLGKEPEAKKSFCETYKEKVKEEQRRITAEVDKAQLIAEMQQSEELLEKSHPMYKELEDILHVIHPEGDFELILSLSDEIKAFTLIDTKTIVLSYGLIKKLGDFLQTRGKPLSKDHLSLLLGNQVTKGQVGFILAHELSHWDEEAKTFHLNETYCDTNGLLMMGKHYNTDDAIDSLEFLKWIEDVEQPEAQVGDDGEREQKHRISLTHPSSENRKVLGLSIVNDPNTHIDGRYIDSEPFPTETALDFIKRGEEWANRARSRWMIASEADIEQEFKSAKTTSEILETFVNADDYYQAQLIKEVSKDKEFGDIILALGIYFDYSNDQYLTLHTDIHKANSEYSLLSKEDFYTQFRIGLLTDKPLEGIPLQAAETTDQTLLKTEYLTPEKTEIVRKCLAGEYGDPWEILTADPKVIAEKFPELADCRFNAFFTALVASVNYYISPCEYVNENLKTYPNPYRAKLLGLAGALNAKDFQLSENGENSNDVILRRKNLIATFKNGLASSIVRMVQEQHALPHTLEPFSHSIIKLVDKYNPLTPDYHLLHERVRKALQESKCCQTPEVAYDLAYMIVNSGRYAQKEGIIWSDWNSENPPYQSLSSDDPSVQQDIRQAIFSTHFALSQGGEELAKEFGKPHIDDFLRSLEFYYDELVTKQEVLFHHPFLDPYDIYLSHAPTISLLHTDSVFDNTPAINLFHRLLPYGRDENGRINYVRECKTVDTRTLVRLITDNIDNRSETISAIMKNPQVSKNIEMVRLLINAGVEKTRLKPSEIINMLEQCGDMALYREYLPYIANEPLQKFHERWFKEFSALPENQGLTKPELIARWLHPAGETWLHLFL